MQFYSFENENAIFVILSNMHELKSVILALAERFQKFEEPLDLIKKKKDLEILESESMDQNLWSDQNRARKVMQDLTDLNNEINEIEDLSSSIKTLVELSEEGEISDDLNIEVRQLEKRLSKLELSIFLSGKYDKNNAIMSIHAGQGGTEAMDFAAMIYRMYSRYIEKRGWKMEELDETLGEEAGIKSIVFRVSANYAFGYLKNEGGTHRLVRQSPFNADALRQTSFALVDVMPELSEAETSDIEIKDEDLDWQFYRAGGKGGQNVNKVSTAVRLSHIPTGIVVTAQTERHQEQNRANALSLLRAKLWIRRQEEIQKEKKEISGDYTPATWGTQIRSYVLHPYKMVKDLRTNVETSDAEGVLDGELDEFIEAEIKLS